MCKYFTATDEFAVPTTRDMDPEDRGTRLMTGLMKAFLTIYEPNDDAHPSLPTPGASFVTDEALAWSRSRPSDQTA
jgi:hypothetical protein